MASLLWFQGGACSGNTMSFLNAEEPSAIDLVTDFGIDVLWHPSLALEMGEHAQRIFRDVASGKRPLDIFVFEGTVILGPNGSGRFDMFADRPMKDWVREIAPRAGVVVAIGDCACWGGIPAVDPNPVDNVGLQYLHRNRGGFLGPDFVSGWGLPVINIPGCPSHPDWVTQILVAVAAGRAKDVALDDLQRPQTFFKTFTQTGCTRVQFFEYKQSSQEFGQGTRQGCLFYELGCRGPMTRSPCNRILWNRQSSKTRAGMPCTGCTEPEYPHGQLAPGTVFKTQKISGTIPKEVPTGTDHVTYMAHAAAARIAAPQWTKEDMFVV
ncbi:MAG: hydrogenase [Gemmatimonadales bacterium]|nr:hydrogenase [Gemmatimonadales bacterium]